MQQGFTLEKHTLYSIPMLDEVISTFFFLEFIDT